MTVKSILRPGIEIQQIFLANDPTLVVPDLPTVIVGPNYQIVDDKALGAPYTGADLTTAYPDLELAAVVKQSSISVKLSAIRLRVDPANLATVNHAVTILGAMVTPAAPNPSFASMGVAVGDKVKVTKNNITTERTVVTPVLGDAADAIRLDGQPGDGAATVVIERVQADTVLVYEITAAQYAALSDVAKASYAASGAVYRHTALEVTGATLKLKADLVLAGEPVASANVRVSYLALRQLTANRVTTVYTAAEITGKLGMVDPRNPLALGVSLAKANTVSSILAMGIAGETAQDWQTAIDFLTNEHVHSICLLTQDAGIQGRIKTHVDGLSLAEKSKFRCAWINLPHPLEKGVASTLVGGKLKYAGGVLSITHPQANFASTVLAGDVVVVSNPAATPGLAAAYFVTGITDNTHLVLDNHKYSGGSGVYEQGAAFAVEFEETVDLTVNRVLDRGGQATQIATNASAYGDRRIMYVTNHQVVVNLGTVSAPIRHTVPGYYLAAAYAGMCAGNPPHQGLTNLGVVGVESVLYGNKYFNEDQLSLIAGSGGFIVLQDTDTSLPYAFIQTTTDNSTVQRRELSVTRTLDFYSFMVKSVLASFIGPYNIIPETLITLQNGVEGIHARLLGMRYPRIGSPILSGKIVSLRQITNEPDAVTLVTDIEIPMPLNRIRVTVEVLGSAQ